MPRPSHAPRAAAPAALIEPLEPRALLAAALFMLDPAESALTLSGTVGGVALRPQSPGSLRAHCEGEIFADYTAGTSIQLLAGVIAAETRGQFDPADAPANFAAGAAPQAAVRFLRLEVTSGLITHSPGYGRFPAAEESFRITHGRLDASGGPAGGVDLAAGPVTSVANASRGASSVRFRRNPYDALGRYADATLRIPVDVTFRFDAAAAVLRLTGRVVAHAFNSESFARGPHADINGPGHLGKTLIPYTVGDPPVPIANASPEDGLTLVDYDSPVLTSFTASVYAPTSSSPDGTIAEDVLSVRTDGTPLAAAYGPGSVILTGEAAPEVYARVLRTLTYVNTSDTPAVGWRILNLRATDGTNENLGEFRYIDVRDVPRPGVARVGTGGADFGRIGDRSVTFTDADGTKATVAVRGPGVATLRFEGAESQVVRNGHISVVGADVRLSSIEIVRASNAIRRTNLVIRTAGGDCTVHLPRPTLPVGSPDALGVVLIGPCVTGHRLELVGLFDPAALSPLMERSDFVSGDFMIHLTFVPPTGPFIT